MNKTTLFRGRRTYGMVSLPLSVDRWSSNKMLNNVQFPLPFLPLFSFACVFAFAFPYALDHCRVHRLDQQSQRILRHHFGLVLSSRHFGWDYLDQPVVSLHHLDQHHKNVFMDYYYSPFLRSQLYSSIYVLDKICKLLIKI